MTCYKATFFSLPVIGVGMLSGGIFGAIVGCYEEPEKFAEECNSTLSDAMRNLQTVKQPTRPVTLPQKDVWVYDALSNRFVLQSRPNY